MAYRPVHFFWMLDCSGSMAMDGKISSLNFAVREAIPEMRAVAAENPKAALLVRVLTFSTGAMWHIEKPTEVDDFSWSDIPANGVTDMGTAFDLVAAQLEMPPMPERALPPVLALVSDGQPTDDWRSGLDRLNHTPWGKKSVRVAIAIGGHDMEPEALRVLKEFLRNPELEPFMASNPKALARAIRWASTVAVRAASEAKDSTQGEVPPPIVPIPTVAGDEDDDEVW